MVLLDVMLQLHALRPLFYSAGDYSARRTVNSIFWLCCLFSILFLYFKKSLEVLLRRGRIRSPTHARTVQYAWNVCFYSAATLYVTLYHRLLLLRPELATPGGHYFPPYPSVLFSTACDVARLELVTLVLVAFDLVSAAERLRGGDYSEAFGRALYAALLLCCFRLRLEYFSVLLNLCHGAFHVGRELLLLLSLHTSDPFRLRLFVVLQFSSWAYLFLHVLPFEFLVPTMYANKRYVALQALFGAWYCSCVWNSPLLKLLYHKIYHTHPADCAGGDSSVRCLLLDDSQHFRHQRNLERAYLELKLHHDRSKLSGTRATGSDSENHSARAFQTIKCVLTLKRKLKRLRENRDQQLNP